MCAFCRNLLSRCFSCHRQEKYPCNVIFWVWARVKGRVFPGGQWDHFLAIIRKNILRAVFPGRGLMARWHNGGGGVLSSSRSGGRGARGRRQPTIMDSPSFHSLSFLVDVFVFIFVFVFVHLCWILFCFFYDDGQHIRSPSFHSLSFLVDIFVCLIVFVFVFVLNFVIFLRWRPVY